MIRNRRISSRSRNRGSLLIEAMIGILIFSFGVLGMVGLQANMSRAQGSAKFRADAVNLGSELIGAMWVDRPNFAKYDTSTTCASHLPCADWLGKVAARLPQGTAGISTAGDGGVALTVTWSTTTEGTHSYVLGTNINY